MKTKLDWALEAQAKGLGVFPLTWTDADGACSCGDVTCNKPGKHPIAGSNGFQDAKYTETEVRGQWDRTPEANIGVYPGETWAIIDIDMKNGKDGRSALTAALGYDIIEHIELGLINGYVVQTTTGGWHVYYKTTEPYASRVGVLSGVDVRAVGGYVLYAGSVIGDKSYTVFSDGAPSLPDEKLLETVLKKPREKVERKDEASYELDLPENIERARQWLEGRAPAISGSGGNDWTYKTAQFVRDLGISHDECLRLMWAVYNPKCEPEWSGDELLQIVDNAYTYGQNTAGAKSSAYMSMLAEGLTDIASFDFTKETEVGATGDENRFDKIMTRGPATLQSNQKREYIIPGWLLSHGFTGLLAKRSVGKTVIMLDIALHICHGLDWHGWPINKSKDWCVVYVCGEDSVGAREQIKAWHIEHKLEFPTDRFILIDGIMDLTDPEDVKACCYAIGRKLGHVLCEDGKYRTEKHAAVFVDTWQRATASVSQNDDKDMQQPVRHIEIIADYCRGPSLIAFHPPKGNEETITGSAIIENSSTAIWKLEKKTGAKRSLYVTRIKGKGDGNERTFDFKEVTILKDGQPVIDEFGKPETGVVPVWLSGDKFNQTTEQKQAAEAKQAVDERTTLAELVWCALNAPNATLPMSQSKLAVAIDVLIKKHNENKTSGNEKIACEAYSGQVGESQIAKGLKLHFADQANSPFDFGQRPQGHYKLFIEKKGSGNMYSFKPATLLAQTTAPAEPEREIEITMEGLGDEKSLDQQLGDIL